MPFLERNWGCKDFTSAVAVAVTDFTSAVAAYHLLQFPSNSLAAVAHVATFSFAPSCTKTHPPLEDSSLNQRPHRSLCPMLSR